MGLDAHNYIQSSNGVISVLIPTVKDFNLISALVVIGLLYAVGFLLVEQSGLLSNESFRINAIALVASVIWILTTVVGALVEIAQLIGGSFFDAFDFRLLREFFATTSIGRDYIFQIVLGGIVITLISRARKVGAIYYALAITMSALLVPLLQSHAASAGNHGLAIGSLIFHVASASLWAGGVIGLVVITPTARNLAISRFSTLALWCAIIVGISGALNAWTRLNDLQGWLTLYGGAVLLKILLFLILVVIGSKHRRHIADNLQGTAQFLRLLINESVILIGAVAIGGWLSTAQPPASPSSIASAADPVVRIVGMPMPSQPTISRILFAYVPDGTVLGILILILALYVRGVLILSRRGDTWPVGRTISFAIGIALVDFATSGGLGVYAHFAFSYHMLAHMTLGMIAPIGLVLGAPITLALRTLPQGRTKDERGVRGTLIRIIHSRYSIIITNPVVALVLFDGSLFLLYMTPIFGKLMQSHSGHLVMDMHFLLAGYLFFYVIIGVDPNPRKIPHIVRIIVLLAAMSIHAFFSIALLSTTTLVDGGYFTSLNRPWNLNLLADQHLGGAIGWAMGEIPILLALIVTFIQWMRDDSRETRRIDRSADRAAAMGEDDELAKYNKYLATLADRDRQQFKDVD
jgi:putative copper resistance protein D